MTAPVPAKARDVMAEAIKDSVWFDGYGAFRASGLADDAAEALADAGWQVVPAPKEANRG